MVVGSDWRKQFRKLLTVSLSELNPLRGEEAFLSVDIGSASVKILEVRGAGPRARVTAFGAMPTPPGAVQSNMVYEPSAVAETIRTVIDGRGMRAKKVVAAIPGPAVIIKRLSMPAQPPEEAESAIVFEAGNCIPEDLENVNLDYQILGHGEDSKRMEVLLVAAKKDIVATYTDTIRLAGLTPVVVDVDYFALSNMFEFNYETDPESVCALVNIGARYSAINILKGCHSTFTGDVPVGGRDITDSLMRDLGVSAEEAETLKTGGSVPKVPASQAQGSLAAASEGLIDEIQHALGFFWSAATDEAIDRVYLSGGAVRVPGLAEAMGRRLEMAVDVIDPFSRLPVDPRADTPGLRQSAPALAVAVGLGLRRPGDK